MIYVERDPAGGVLLHPVERRTVYDRCTRLLSRRGSAPKGRAPEFGPDLTRSARASLREVEVDHDD